MNTSPQQQQEGYKINSGRSLLTLLTQFIPLSLSDVAMALEDPLQIHPQELTLGNLTLDYSNNKVITKDAAANKQEIALTNKEFQLLEYFMKHPNHIITSEQLRYQLWEVNVEPVSNVVAAQVRLLRRKLANSGYQNMIETLHGLGYRLNLTHETK